MMLACCTCQSFDDLQRASHVLHEVHEQGHAVHRNGPVKLASDEEEEVIRRDAWTPMLYNEGSYYRLPIR